MFLVYDIHSLIAFYIFFHLIHIAAVGCNQTKKESSYS